MIQTMTNDISCKNPFTPKYLGISKGGLLHHFPNKQALINAMVEETTNRYFSDIHERATNDSSEVGKWSRAYIHATFDEKQEDDGVIATLIVSLFANPNLLRKLRNLVRINHGRILVSNSCYS